MNSALLSRFDLVFILLDQPNEELDGILSEHVMSLHSNVGERNKRFIFLRNYIYSKAHLEGYHFSDSYFVSTLVFIWQVFCIRLLLPAILWAFCSK